MLRIKTKDKKIIMYNDLGRDITFELSQKHIFAVIKKNIDKINKDGVTFSMEKLGNGICHLILDMQHRIMIPELSAYEISSRMMLLNDKLIMPSENIVDGDEQVGKEE